MLLFKGRCHKISHYRRNLLLMILIILIILHSNSVYSEPSGYLKQGTFAISPEDERTIFLYIPSKTLLYDLKEDKIKIGSSAFPDRQNSYRKAITQDGIEALIWDQVISTNGNIVNRYDFFVNRRLPMCITENSCDEIWRKFNLRSDEGEGWKAIWPGAGGKFKEEVGNLQKVSMDAGGWEEGFIPSKRGGFTIEDNGYISKTDRAYPLYKYLATTMYDLCTQCGQTVIDKDKSSLYTKLETYGKASANVSIDPTTLATKYIPKKYAKMLLEIFGLEAGVSLEGFVDGSWKKTAESETTKIVKYGNEHESWIAKDVYVEKRAISDLGTDSDYKPFGRVLIKKVYKCRSNEKVDLNYISFLMSFYDENGKQESNIIKISLDKQNLPNEFKLKNETKPNALVTIDKRADHFRIIEFFLQEGIPKSIGSLFITEFNRSSPK